MGVARTKNTAKRNETGENTRWVVGLLLFIVGVYITAATLFYFFDWRGDNSVLAGLNAENPRADQRVDNPCGWLGAWAADQIVGRSMGLFGIILPVVVMIFGLRLLRQKPLSVNRFGLSALLVMICGTVTLGFAFRGSGMFGSGWGGAWGILAAEWLDGCIGWAGTLITVVAGWILTGVFINSNFIHTVNRAGKMVVNGGEQILTTVTKRVVSHGSPGEDAEAEEPAAPVTPASAPRPAPGPAPTPAPAAGPTPEPAYAAEDDREERNPFTAGTEDAQDPYNIDVQPFTQTATPAGEAEVRPAGAERGAADGQGGRSGESGENGPGAWSERTPLPERRISIDNLEEELQKMEAATALGIIPGRTDEPSGPFVEIPIEEEPATGPTAGERPDSEWMPTEENPFVELPEEPKEGGAAGTEGAQDAEEEREENGGERFGQTVAGQNVAEEERSPFAEEAEGADAPAPHAARHADEEGIVVTVEEHEAQQLDEEEFDTSLYDPLKDLRFYRKPTPGLMQDYPSDSKVTDVEIFENKSRIENVLKQFGIPIRSIHATPGPTVTLYEIVQCEGIKISKIQGLENDIAQNLKALGIRLITPIPGKGTIGIEVPNKHKQIVSMYSSILSPEFKNSKAKLPVVIGRTIQNQNYVFDLADMPHLLVAGATGQGKSVGLNAIITSLLYKKHPAELKLVMIDPKTVEFSLYAKIEKHFLAKMESEERAIITDPRKAVYTLNALCIEMEARLDLCGKAGTRNISEYNEKFINRRLDPCEGHRFMPYIVVVIDEFADLIMTAKEVQTPVMRLAQKARAIGIHLIVATQRPDVKVITGTIKANFPARIAFRVMQMSDSRTILDQTGANQLIGRGDMLLSRNGELTRIQCAFADTKDVECIVDYISRQQGYPSAYLLPDYEPESAGGEASLGSEESGKPVKYDVLFGDIARAAVESGQISTSHIQRTFEVGFNRAGRIMMQLQRAGIVGPQEGVKPREVLYHDLLSLEAKLQDLGVS